MISMGMGFYNVRSAISLYCAYACLNAQRTMNYLQLTIVKSIVGGIESGQFRMDVNSMIIISRVMFPIGILYMFSKFNYYFLVSCL